MPRDTIVNFGHYFHIFSQFTLSTSIFHSLWMHWMEFWYKLYFENLLSIFVIQIGIFYVNLLGYNAHNDYMPLIRYLINIIPSVWGRFPRLCLGPYMKIFRQLMDFRLFNIWDDVCIPLIKSFKMTQTRCF